MTAHAEAVLDLDIAALHAAYVGGELSPVAVTDAVLERLESLEPVLHAFLAVRADAARHEAAQAARAFAAGAPTGLLAGVPVSVKDMFLTRELPTSLGSGARRDRRAEADAAVWTVLGREGAVRLGKTNLREFSYGYVHPDLPRANNPWDPARTAGGSSSGSAAAVAAGIGWASIGSDTGGSVRLPASFCGVVGMKPTHGAIDAAGLFPLAPSLDAAGVLTRRVGDNAIVLAATAPAFAAAKAATPLAGTRVGVVEEALGPPTEPEVLAACSSALDVLADLGVGLEGISLPRFAEAADIGGVIIGAEAAFHHARLLDADARRAYGPGVRGNIELGERIPATRYLDAVERRRALGEDIRRALRGVDVLACPTLPCVATPDDPGTPEENDAVSRWTIPFNLTGGPALSVPAGLTSAGLPVGLQLAGGPGDEAKLYQLGAALEAACGGFPAPPVMRSAVA